MTAHGGPQPESTIEYSIKSDSIASVSSGGLINALGLGVTTVIGKAVGLGADSGMVVYSQVGEFVVKQVFFSTLFFFPILGRSIEFLFFASVFCFFSLCFFMSFLYHSFGDSYFGFYDKNSCLI